MQNCASEAKMDQESLARKIREKEVALRQYKAADQALQLEKEGLPNYK